MEQREGEVSGRDVEGARQPSLRASAACSKNISLPPRLPGPGEGARNGSQTASGSCPSPDSILITVRA